MVFRHQLVRFLLPCVVSGLFIGGFRILASQASVSEIACCLIPLDGGTTFECQPFTNFTYCIGVLGGSPADSVTCSSLCAPPTNRPPDCTKAQAFPPRLDPPRYPSNHQLVPVNIGGVIDPDGDPVTVTIGDIFQDEEVINDGSGQSCPDGDVLDGLIRAERQGKGNGRVYHVDFMADDGKGGTCQGTVQVCVPHDRASACVDDGPLFDSTAPDGCEGRMVLEQCQADCASQYAACSQVAHVDFNECIAVELRRVCAAELAANLKLCRETLNGCIFDCFQKFGEG